MKKFIFLLLFFPALCQSAEVGMAWGPVDGASGYKVYQSVDQGKTWTELATVAEPAYDAHSVPDTGLVLFRVSAVGPSGESISREKGAWYCGDFKLPAPGGLGAK